MFIYLPIAEMAVNIFSIIALGFGVGILSGMVGISGGFLLTPILIVMGIPSTIAVASQSAGIIATSTTGVITHLRASRVDFKMLSYILAGAIAGSSIGVIIFSILKDAGSIDLVVKILYIFLLSFIGFFMFFEIFRTRVRRVRGTVLKHHNHHNKLHFLPFRTRFKKSRLYISVLPPIFVGFIIGMVSAIMGVGGGFMMVPAMVYILGMHSSVVIGTSLFQSIIVAMNATFWQAYLNHSVDIVLSTIIILGGVLGALVGVKAYRFLNPEQLRFILALAVMSVGIKLFFDLIIPPEFLFSYTLINGLN